MHHSEYALLLFLAVSLVLALVLGLITERLRLSPIVGYLLAGIALGPNTPGIVGDAGIAHQLAEMGVVLLMFGVGLHFDVRDLWAVRKIAIPGAVGQSIVATALSTIVVHAYGWSWMQGAIVGIAVSVASTVVLIRVLTDNDVLHTPQGHIAIGWLIVEDIFTVLVLVALPAVAAAFPDAVQPSSDVANPAAQVAHADSGPGVELAPVDDHAEPAEAEEEADEAEEPPHLASAIGMALLNIAVLGAIILGGGRYVIPWLLGQVARTRSRELFTLSVLAVALAIATGSFYFFGVSMALGAFLAGMVVGQTEVSHQAAADALPMRDAFAVVFFVSVGMLFNPDAVLHHPWLLLSMMGIILLAKPLAAAGIVWFLRYSFRSAITVAIALAQVGEFSFLLAQEAIHHKLMSEEGRSLLVACAILSITLNPLIFRLIEPLERWLRARPNLYKMIGRRAEAGGAAINQKMSEIVNANSGEGSEGAGNGRSHGSHGAPAGGAVIVGFGPVGQTATRILRDFNVEPVVVDLNLDTVRDLAGAGKLAVYGDATRRDILEAAGIRNAKYLMVTVPDVLIRTLVIMTAKELNPGVQVFARARYIKERAWLEDVGATQICTEEAETALGLAVLLLREVGADQDRVRREIEKLHNELGVQRTDKDFRPHYEIQQEII